MGHQTGCREEEKGGDLKMNCGRQAHPVLDPSTSSSDHASQIGASVSNRGNGVRRNAEEDEVSQSLLSGFTGQSDVSVLFKAKTARYEP